MWKNRPLVDRISEKFSTSSGRDFFGGKLLLGMRSGVKKKGPDETNLVRALRKKEREKPAAPYFPAMGQYHRRVGA